MKHVRIVNFKDIYGKDIPILVRDYEVIYTHDEYVSVGLGGHEFYKVPWENVDVLD